MATIRNSSSFVDVVVCDYDTRGELKQFVVHLDTSHPSSLAPSERQRIEQVIVLAHAATRFLPEDVRPLKLATIVRRGPVVRNVAVCPASPERDLHFV